MGTDGETCADCGLPITMEQPSYYSRAPGEDIGRTFHGGCGDPFGVKAKDAEISRLRSDLEKARKALRPFAKLSSEFNVHAHDDEWTVHQRGASRIEVGDLRRARTALSPLPADGEPP